MKAKHTSLRQWVSRFLAAIILLTLLAPASSRAAKSAETNSFAKGVALFQGAFYHGAETAFGVFLARYTNSPLVAEAALYQARACIYQSNYTGAIQLLQRRLPVAGDLAADFIFHIAEANLKSGEYQTAANSFGNMIKNFPRSPLCLDAARCEALAYSKLQDWGRVVDLLGAPDGAFQTGLKASPQSESAVSGLLLLGEAFFWKGQFDNGEKVISGMDVSGASDELKWQRQYLLCRLELAGGRATEAFQNSTNLESDIYGQSHRVDSLFLKGEILEKLDRPAEALPVYTNNLAENLPASVQRQALAKTITLTVELTPTADAIQWLTTFIQERPGSSVLDLAGLNLGELCLKAYYTTQDTNLLQQAIARLDSVIQNFPDSPLLGKAHLDRGWCDWEQQKYPEAGTNFLVAVNLLPESEDQAVARFKLADAQFQETNYTEAVANYNLLLQQYANAPAVANGLFDQALYQILQASINLGDTNAAWEAANEILNRYPNSLFGEKGLLLMGEDLNRKYNYKQARDTFSALVAKSTNTDLLPKVEFAIARTYDQEGGFSNWVAAVDGYDQWLTNFPTNSLLPQVEYSRALACSKAGQETNAFELFTNFVTLHADDPLAPLAQYWIGDFYFSHGDYAKADFAYQQLYQNFSNAGQLAFKARLMAGRSAFAHQDIKQAGTNFLDLINDTNTPPSLVAEAWFALGDMMLEQFKENTNATDLAQAETAFNYLTNPVSTTIPTNFAPLALGKLGECYRQWADLNSDPKATANPDAYTNAVLMYEAVLSLPQADVSTRSQAEVGLGQIAEREGRSDQALDHYFNVLFQDDPDKFDPYWVKEAGVRAARICEEGKQWDKALKIYDRVLKVVPSLKPTLERKIDTATKALAAKQNSSGS